MVPLITTTFCFYSVESFIAGVRKHRKTFHRLLFIKAKSSLILPKNTTRYDLGGKANKNTTDKHKIQTKTKYI